MHLPTPGHKTRISTLLHHLRVKLILLRGIRTRFRELELCAAVGIIDELYHQTPPWKQPTGEPLVNISQMLPPGGSIRVRVDKRNYIFAHGLSPGWCLGQETVGLKFSRMVMVWRVQATARIAPLKRYCSRLSVDPHFLT